MAKKTPKTNKSVSTSKEPRSSADGNSYLKKNPTWKFSRVDLAHTKWSIKDCCDFSSDVLSKLVSFEQQTWSEITVTNSNHNHHISVGNLIREAQKRLNDLNIDADELFFPKTGWQDKAIWNIGCRYFLYNLV